MKISMKKDVLAAIGGGLILGAVFALAVTNLPQIVKNLKVPLVKPTPSPLPEVTTAPQNQEFTIETPADESVSENKNIDISGVAKTGKLVLLESATDNTTINLDSSGHFTGKLNLIEGVNTIYVTLYDEDGNSATKTLNVYYTTEKL